MTKIQNDPYGQKAPATDIGTMLAPLFTWRGKDIYPVHGASQPEGEPDSEPDEDDDAGKEPKDPDGAATVSREDFDRLQRQLSAADKKRNDAEARLKELDDAQKDELTKVTERAAELEKLVQAQDKDLADMRLQNAFLTAETGVTWHDPGDALALAERKGYLEGVVVDGKVDGTTLATKLRELAKASPHLVKAETETEGGKPPVRTGAPVGGKTKKTKADEPDLSRYERILNR